MDMVDTTKDVGKGLLSIYKKFDQIRIGGYIQPQYQIAQDKGIKGYAGGDFGPQVSNRFMIRRGRIRFEYARFNEDHKASVQFVFQFDGTERGVFIRDFWGRYFENKLELFSFSMGMFARPFGYEVNLASSDRESPERGRMSQILMKTERDLGGMVSFEPRKKDHPLRFLKIDAGFFNGQGLTAPADYDSYKDFISRISLKPIHLSPTVMFSTGISLLYGGFYQNTPNIYRVGTNSNGDKNFILDSSAQNIGKKDPRRYYGADAQLKIKNAWGFLELRAEYIFGQQTSTYGSSETPSALLQEPAYIRHFNGAYLYFLQHIINLRHQLCIKYDWYDPNTQVAGKDIGKQATNLNATDIRFGDLGIGYIFYCNENLKLVLWYDIVKNEITSLPGYTQDVKDNVLTLRLQFRF
ncbi:MAG: porin [Bacteroidetes bacterium]|nr:porin [Bacteroidota bacterium]